MAMSSARKRLAQRLLQNWRSKSSVDPMFQQSDDSLTTLSWLHSPNAMQLGSAAGAATTVPVMDYNEISADPNAILDMSPGGEGGITLPRPVATVEIPPTAVLGRADYKKCGVKPHHSYSTLICMAIKESQHQKLTLADIYGWITNNFEYYRTADLSWQNSIRHNLSLNKCFEKVPRRKDEPGKGGFWRINPEYSDTLVDGIFKKRRFYNVPEIVNPLAKRVKRDGLLAAVKLEPREDESAVLNLQAEDLPSALTGADFNWNTILPEDQESECINIKVERSEVEIAAASITSLSPPPSDASDSGFDDFFNADLNDAVDLTVQGHSIPTSEWWGEDINKSGLNSSSNFTSLPVFPDQQAEFTHPWAEGQSDFEEAIAHFDLDLQNLLEDDKPASSPRTVSLVC